MPSRRFFPRKYAFFSLSLSFSRIHVMDHFSSPPELAVDRVRASLFLFFFCCLAEEATANKHNTMLSGSFGFALALLPLYSSVIKLSKILWYFLKKRRHRYDELVQNLGVFFHVVLGTAHFFYTAALRGFFSGGCRDVTASATFCPELLSMVFS